MLRRSDVTELKAWSRRAWWEAHALPRQKARAVVERASAPWRFAREAVRVFPAYAPLVAHDFGVPRRLQLLHLAWARLRYGLDPTAYYRFQLFRPERWLRAGRYVQTADTGRVLRWLSHTPGYPRVFGDKRAFEAWCVDRDLPTVRTLMEFEAGCVTRTLAPNASLPRVDLFSKPSNSQGGFGAERWMYRDGRYVGSDGVAHDDASLTEALARRSIEIDKPVLLQRAIRNAPHDAHLTVGALCTARITTLRMPGEEPTVVFAIHRIPADAAAAVDNFCSGGLASVVDLETGRLGPAVRKDFLLQPAVCHPNTGARIEGHRLRHWPEAMRLALRAHSAVTWKGVPVIGWDVALLDDGPLLIEGNNVPCSTFSQVVLEQPLGETPIVACLNAHLRECFGAAPGR